MSDRLTTHRARVRWLGGKVDLRAHEVRLAEQALHGSCSPAWGGDPEKADPEEMFVAALSSCHMLWFLDFARRERLRVVSYEDAPEGHMDERRFVEVILRPAVTFAGEVSTEAVAVLHERAHDACFIANSVNCEVRIELAG